MPRILWRDSGSGLEARQWKARHGLLYSLLSCGGTAAAAVMRKLLSLVALRVVP